MRNHKNKPPHKQILSINVRKLESLVYKKIYRVQGFLKLCISLFVSSSEDEDQFMMPCVCFLNCKRRGGIRFNKGRHTTLNRIFFIFQNLIKSLCLAIKPDLSWSIHKSKISDQLTGFGVGMKTEFLEGRLFQNK